MSPTVPSTCRAVLYHGPGKDLTLETISTPSPLSGTVIIHVLAATVEASFQHIFDGHVPGLFIPPNTIPGGRSIGRIVMIGPDTTELSVNQLVMLDPFIRARDNPHTRILWGISAGSTSASKALFQSSGAIGMWTEYTRAPLENVCPLNEARLLGDPKDGGLGYKISDLIHIPRALVAYGGLRAIDLKAGETVIVAPATGKYSAAAVDVASAMGARVIAVGRNLEALQKVAKNNSRVEVLQLKDNVEEDVAALQKFGTIDAFLDISPFAATGSTHVRSCMLALRNYGRVSLMGVLGSDIAVPYVVAMFKNLTIKGQYMHEPEDAKGIVKMVETGILRLGESAGQHVVAEFGLEQFEEALRTAEAHKEPGSSVIFCP